jgi:hypothetical protein
VQLSFKRTGKIFCLTTGLGALVAGGVWQCMRWWERVDIEHATKQAANSVVLLGLERELQAKNKIYTRSALQDFEGLMQRANLKNTWNNCLARVDFMNQKFYSNTAMCERVDQTRITWLLDFLNAHVSARLEAKRSFSFVIPLNDTGVLPRDVFEQASVDNVAVLMVDASQSFYRVHKDLFFLVPDFHVLRKSFASNLKLVQRAAKSRPFQERKDVVFWRGCPTGGTFNMETKDELPRYRLVDFSYHHPDYADARFVQHDGHLDVSDSGRTYRAFMDARFGAKPHRYYTKIQDHTKYRYLASLDGNVSAWERVIYLLNSGSVLLLQTQHLQFFTSYLKEEEHFVGLKNDISDMSLKIDQLRADPKRAMRIIDNALLLGRQLDTGLFIAYYERVFRFISERFEEDVGG